jgi:hypothetical protein
MTATRISIRVHTYHSVLGFLICGTNARGHHVRIFTKTRTSAEHIRGLVKLGRDVTVADFDA